MGQKIKYICVSFDVDLVNYLSDSPASEMETVFPLVRNILIEFPQIKTSWFIRIDQQVEAVFGIAEYVFSRFSKELRWLSENGHDVGWHHHAYTFIGNRWLPQNNATIVLQQLKRIVPLTKKYDLKISRMGWGTQSVAITDFLESSGFIVDSSAIPRPVYPWDGGLKDWDNAPTEPFYPAAGTYKEKGAIRDLLQVPISTVVLPFEGDTIPNVIRYINPAYHTAIFQRAVQSFQGSILTTVSHPYELMASETSIKSPLAFSLDSFRENLRYLTLLSDVSFITLSELRQQVLQKSDQTW